MKNLHILIPFLFMALSCSAPSEIKLTGGSGWTSRKEYSDFGISGQARTSEGAVAAIRFCLAGDAEGYEVLLRNGPADGTCKTGSRIMTGIGRMHAWTASWTCWKNTISPWRSTRGT